MAVFSYLNVPIWLLGIAGTDKSPRKNPLLGVQSWNERGFHRERVRIAAQLAERRRARLAGALSQEDRAAFDKNGYFLTENFLPDAEFQALKEAAFGNRFDAREMRQGETVTRMTPIPPTLQKRFPEIARAVNHPRALAQIRYASSRGGQPLCFFQTVIAEPGKGPEDPQTSLHQDTFHATAKAWLFLHDVGEDEGPFCYVPGSHIANKMRLEWEYQCSLTAARDPRSHHASGSFRIRPHELSALGLPEPVRLAVPANTLVVADTFGFHGRTPSKKPTTRVELHWHIRRNPFLPWNGGDIKSFPGIRGWELPAFLAVSDVLENIAGSRTIWRPVGKVALNSPTHI